MDRPSTNREGHVPRSQHHRRPSSSPPLHPRPLPPKTLPYMGNAISATGVLALCASMSAVHKVTFRDPCPGASATVAAQAPPLYSGVRDLQLLASAAGFFISVTFIYRHLHLHPGDGNRRLPEIVSFMLCVCAGVLQFLLFMRAPGGADVDHGAEACALGLAALRVLPAAATVTFFLGTMLIFASAGGEGGGGAIAIAAAGEGEEPIQAPVGLRLLSRMALAAAAGLVCLMAVAVYGAYWLHGGNGRRGQCTQGLLLVVQGVNVGHDSLGSDGLHWIEEVKHREIGASVQGERDGGGSMGRHNRRSRGIGSRRRRSRMAGGLGEGDATGRKRRAQGRRWRRWVRAAQRDARDGGGDDARKEMGR